MKTKRLSSIFANVPAVLVLILILTLGSGASAGPKFKVLHAFGSGKCGGGCGTVYKMSRQAGGLWTQKVVHSFKNANDFVFGGLADDGQGNLYGTTAGTGILFELTSRAGREDRCARRIDRIQTNGGSPTPPQ